MPGRLPLTSSFSRDRAPEPRCLFILSSTAPILRGNSGSVGSSRSICGARKRPSKKRRQNAPKQQDATHFSHSLAFSYVRLAHSFSLSLRVCIDRERQSRERRRASNELPSTSSRSSGVSRPSICEAACSIVKPSGSSNGLPFGGGAPALSLPLLGEAGAFDGEEDEAVVDGEEGEG